MSEFKRMGEDLILVHGREEYVFSWDGDKENLMVWRKSDGELVAVRPRIAAPPILTFPFDDCETRYVSDPVAFGIGMTEGKAVHEILSGQIK